VSDGRTLAATAMLFSVYDGQRCIGFIIARGKLGFEAFDHDERALVVFPSKKLASVAVSSEAVRVIEPPEVTP
jgi:hypothetical protein